MSFTPQVTFDGRTYQPQNIEEALRQAAQGMAPTHNKDVAFAPLTWAQAFVRALVDAHLQPELQQAVTALLRDPDDTVATFAAKLQRSVSLVDTDTLAEALAQHAKAGNTEVLSPLAFEIAQAAQQPGFVYPSMLRDAASRPNAKAVLAVVLEHDRDWFLKHIDDILHDDDAIAHQQLMKAAFYLDSQATRALLDDLDAHTSRTSVAQKLRATLGPYLTS